MPVFTNALLKSAEWENGRRNTLMINLHESYVPSWDFTLHHVDMQSDMLLTALWKQAKKTTKLT